MELERRVIVVLGALLVPVLSAVAAGGGPVLAVSRSHSGAVAPHSASAVAHSADPAEDGHSGAAPAHSAAPGSDSLGSGDSGWGKAMGCGCAHGRPLTGTPLPAGVVSRADWLDRTVRPELAGVADADRRWLGWVWSSIAANEHASVAAFHRAALELHRVGGPDRLVAALERAAADERRHARQAFGLASAFAGRPLGPAAAEGRVPVAATLAEVAARTVAEGCGEEARSLAVAVAQREVAQDPAVRAVLDGIVRDEARHVRLAARVVWWAVRAGGPEVADAVRRAAQAPLSPIAVRSAAPASLARFGVLGDDVLERVAAHADAELLRPARLALAA